MLETRDPSTRGGVGGAEGDQLTATKLPSRDVYQGFLAHEAEGLREKKKKGKTKEEEEEKKDIWHFRLFLNKHPRV